MGLAYRARRARRRDVRVDRAAVAPSHTREYVLRRRHLLCTHRCDSRTISPCMDADPLRDVRRRGDGGGVCQRLSAQPSLAIERVGLQRSAASYYGASMSPLHLLLGCAECGRVAGIPPLSRDDRAAAYSLCGQTLSRGHTSHFGERALQISRPNSTNRWQKSLLSSGGRMARSCISTL